MHVQTNLHCKGLILTLKNQKALSAIQGVNKIHLAAVSKNSVVFV